MKTKKEILYRIQQSLQKAKDTDRSFYTLNERMRLLGECEALLWVIEKTNKK